MSYSVIHFPLLPYKFSLAIKLTPQSDSKAVLKKNQKLTSNRRRLQFQHYTFCYPISNRKDDTKPLGVFFFYNRRYIIYTFQQLTLHRAEIHLH